MTSRTGTVTPGSRARPSRVKSSSANQNGNSGNVGNGGNTGNTGNASDATSTVSSRSIMSSSRPPPAPRFHPAPGDLDDDEYEWESASTYSAPQHGSARMGSRITSASGASTGMTMLRDGTYVPESEIGFTDGPFTNANTGSGHYLDDSSKRHALHYQDLRERDEKNPGMNWKDEHILVDSRNRDHAVYSDSASFKTRLPRQKCSHLEIVCASVPRTETALYGNRKYGYLHEGWHIGGGGESAPFGSSAIAIRSLTLVEDSVSRTAVFPAKFTSIVGWSTVTVSGTISEKYVSVQTDVAHGLAEGMYVRFANVAVTGLPSRPCRVSTVESAETVIVEIPNNATTIVASIPDMPIQGYLVFDLPDPEAAATALTLCLNNTTSAANVFSVTYSRSTGVFSLARSSGTGKVVQFNPSGSACLLSRFGFSSAATTVNYKTDSSATLVSVRPMDQILTVAFDDSVHFDETEPNTLDAQFVSDFHFRMNRFSIASGGATLFVEAEGERFEIEIPSDLDCPSPDVLADYITQLFDDAGFDIVLEVEGTSSSGQHFAFASDTVSFSIRNDLESNVATDALMLALGYPKGVRLDAQYSTANTRYELASATDLQATYPVMSSSVETALFARNHYRIRAAGQNVVVEAQRARVPEALRVQSYLYNSTTGLLTLYTNIPSGLQAGDEFSFVETDASVSYSSLLFTATTPFDYRTPFVVYSSDHETIVILYPTDETIETTQKTLTTDERNSVALSTRTIPFVLLNSTKNVSSDGLCTWSSVLGFGQEDVFSTDDAPFNQCVAPNRWNLEGPDRAYIKILSRGQNDHVGVYQYSSKDGNSTNYESAGYVVFSRHSADSQVFYTSGLWMETAFQRSERVETLHIRLEHSDGTLYDLRGRNWFMGLRLRAHI